MTMKAWALSVVDRAVRTGLQTLLAYLSVAELISDIDWLAAAAAAGFAMVVSVLTRLIDAPSFGDTWLFQLAERAVKTFAQALLVGIGTATLFEQVDWKMAFNAAALAAVYSVVTSVLTTRLGADQAMGQVDLSVPPNRAVLDR